MALAPSISTMPCYSNSYSCIIPILIIYLLASVTLGAQGQSQRAQSQGRAPHGLSNEQPVAFSPSAFEFFHPSNRADPCSHSACSPVAPAALAVAATAATVSSSLAQESRSGRTGSDDGKANAGPRAIVAVVLGCVLGMGVVAAAIGLYYVAVVKKNIMIRSFKPTTTHDQYV